MFLIALEGVPGFFNIFLEPFRDFLDKELKLEVLIYIECLGVKRSYIIGGDIILNAFAESELALFIYRSIPRRALFLSLYY